LNRRTIQALRCAASDLSVLAAALLRRGSEAQIFADQAERHARAELAHAIRVTRKGRKRP